MTLPQDGLCDVCPGGVKILVIDTLQSTHGPRAAPLTQSEADDDASLVRSLVPDKNISEDGIRYVTNAYSAKAKDKARAQGILPNTPEFEKLLSDAVEEASRDMYFCAFSERDAQHIMNACKRKEPRFNPWNVLQCRELLDKAWEIFGTVQTPPHSARDNVYDHDNYD